MKQPVGEWGRSDSVRRPSGTVGGADARRRDAGVAALAVAAGLLHGLVNGATLGPSGASGLALGGAITSGFCLMAVVCAEVTALPAGWHALSSGWPAAGLWLRAC